MSTSATVVTEKVSPIATTTNTTKTVVTEKNNTVVIDNKQATIVLTGLMGPAGVSTLQGLSNVDVTNLTNGGVLVYNSTSQKWVATTTLDAQNMEGGYY
jgi:hypothetical protein